MNNNKFKNNNNAHIRKSNNPNKSVKQHHNKYKSNKSSQKNKSNYQIIINIENLNLSPDTKIESPKKSRKIWKTLCILNAILIISGGSIASATYINEINSPQTEQSMNEINSSSSSTNLNIIFKYTSKFLFDIVSNFFEFEK